MGGEHAIRFRFRQVACGFADLGFMGKDADAVSRQIFDQSGMFFDIIPEN